MIPTSAQPHQKIFSLIKAGQREKSGRKDAKKKTIPTSFWKHPRGKPARP
jgi:hypothetical protein